MKTILITGADSYIGTSFEKWVSKWPDEYSVDTIDMRCSEWKEISFRGYDVILHVAAIVHVKENDVNQYFRVNRDLAIEVARKAKAEGVRQFIFFSTMGVYGSNVSYVDEKTMPNPVTPYARSKLEAENMLLNMEDEFFKVAVLRPPLVYGKNCKGNYQRLTRLAKNLPLFPSVINERSMIYIDNLSEFVRLLINCGIGGLFFPQNKDYVNTTTIAKLIAKAHGRRLRVTKIFNPGVILGLKFSETFRKVFGSYVYAKGMPGGPNTEVNGQICNYETVSFPESIRLTEE
ncbi:MAG: NAD-dependent epimerase/dehydratase family protein [Clostridiaceae bacterium]|nr:NAD-dependent epimerase/dehydratase family protein [Clostridiaceae bacterium]